MHYMFSHVLRSQLKISSLLNYVGCIFWNITQLPNLVLIARPVITGYPIFHRISVSVFARVDYNTKQGMLNMIIWLSHVRILL